MKKIKLSQYTAYKEVLANILYSYFEQYSIIKGFSQYAVHITISTSHNLKPPGFVYDKSRGFYMLYMLSSACAKSSMMSSMFSIPTENLTRSGDTPAAINSSSVN